MSLSLVEAAVDAIVFFFGTYLFGRIPPPFLIELMELEIDVKITFHS